MTQRYYTDMKEDLDLSEDWMTFRSLDDTSLRLWGTASDLIDGVMEGSLGVTEAAALLMALEHREESVLVAMLVADAFTMMGDRPLSRAIMEAVHARIA